MTDNIEKIVQEAECVAAADEYFKARAWLMDTNDNRRIFEAGFDRAYVLLSKLHAEGVQAGDLDKQIDEALAERDQREEIIDKLLDLVLGEGRPEWSSAYDYPDALIQVEDLMHGMKVQISESNRAALASAPVAGEAVAVLRREIGESSWFDHRPVRPGSEEHAAIRKSAEWDYCPVYAAPQASEAVRLDAPAQVGGVRFGKGIHWSTVIAAAQRHHAFMKTPEKEAERIARAKEFVESIQADKDGGDCAKGAVKRLHGLVEEAISWLETGGGRADSLCADLRKALAAQKQGDSDAH